MVFKLNHTLNNGRKFTTKHRLKISYSRRKGRLISLKNGYVIVYQPSHPFAKRHYIKRSRLIVECYIGRYLSDEEEVHHINNISTDDSPDNLYLFKNKAEHMRYHRLLDKKKLKTNIIESCL